MMREVALMKNSTVLFGFSTLILAGALAPVWAAETVVIRNQKIAVTDDRLAPGETRSLPGEFPSVVVYMDHGMIEITPAGHEARNVLVSAGQTAFEPAQPRSIKNIGKAELRLVRVVFATKGSEETWGITGLAPNYKLLFENQYTRTYDIKIKAGASEPQHTHHDRVVICLSGATLMHEMPDGRKEPSTLKTGEIAWRKGGTHIGHNLGQTDLWVIAVEPK
jgi:hypothetical protein